MIIKNRGDNTLSQIISGLSEINKQDINVGHFESQGKHSDSGQSYVDLLTLYAFGQIQDQPRRDVRKQFVFNELSSGRIMQSSEVTRALDNWWQGVVSPQSSAPLLNVIGKYLRKEYKKTFGKVAQYMPTDSDGTPLVETTELRETTAYSTSMNRTPQEGIG